MQQPPQNGWQQMPPTGMGQMQDGRVPPPAHLDLPPVYGAPDNYQSPPGQTWFEEAPTQKTNGPAKPGYRTPPTGMPPVKKKRTIWPFAVLLAVAIAFGAYAVIRLTAPGDAMYGYVTAGSLSARYQGDGVIVRNEIVYTQDGVSQIEYTAEEGAQVHRADPVCMAYTSGFNTRELTTLKKYRDQIKEYHKTLISSTGAGKDAKLSSLDMAVRDRARETRQLIWGAHGSLINQEKMLTTALQARQTYLKQKYPDDQKLARLYDDENTQQQRISSWTKQYAATADGLISFYTDGFEASLNINQYQDYTPAQVRRMYEGQVPASETNKNTVSIYRLVKNDQWVVLMLCGDSDWTPVAGRTYKLLIESFENTVVDATVESFTRSGGELLVRLRVADADVKNVLYIRSCRVQLGENVDSLTVPTRALYSQMGQIGVVIVDEMGNNYWTPVTVIQQEGDVAHIIPNNPGYLYEGMVIKLF